MIKQGVSGGLLSILSFIDENERKALASNSMVKTSSAIREAAKIGLQSLYANADEVLEKYKDFDIVKEMKSRQGANLLWVRARAIDADVVNSNGDYFSEEELLKKTEYQGKKVPAYKTFEGVPIYTNHQNDKVEDAKGMVVYAEWDDEEKCVYCVFFVDEDAYPDIARGIRQGYIHDVSMGCVVTEGVCSICGNKATTEKDYCSCLKQYKGKMHPSGKRAFEYNYGIKFIELSCVGDGAFELCEINEIYDHEEILDKAKNVVKKAQALNSSIVLAASLSNEVHSRSAVETALRQLHNLNSNFIKIAQTAGTLVGGQIIGSGTAQNATVVKILQGLGIDPSSSLNILDLVNLALNFLEVSVLNLFSRKDNIDLSHVAKLTKAMGELQNTLQDMIDDGIETSSRNQTPMVPPQTPQGAPAPQEGQQAPQDTGVPQMPVQQTAKMFNFSPSVGQVVEPFSQQPYVMPLGGGVTASEEKPRMVWASNIQGEEEEFAEKPIRLNAFGRFAVALNELRKACDIPLQEQNKEVPQTSQKNTTASSGDTKIMDHFKKIAQDAKRQKTVKVAIDIKVDDQQGNKLVLSTDKGIRGYHKNSLTNWQPDLTDEQIAQMENGDGYKVATDLLKDFSGIVKKAQAENTIDHLVVYDENLEPEKEYEHTDVRTEVKSQHGAKGDQTMQTKLEDKRKGKVVNEVWEDLLEGERTYEMVRIIDGLAKDAVKPLGDTPLESMIHPEMKMSKVSGKKVMSKVLQAVAKTCVENGVRPKDVLGFLTKVSETQDFGKLMKLARLGTKTREIDALMSKFAQAMPPAPMEEAPIAPPAEPMPTDRPPMEEKALTDVADSVEPEMTEGDIVAALKVIRDSFDEAVTKLNEIVGGEEDEDAKIKEMEEGLKGEDEDLSDDAMKGAVTGLSLAGEEAGASPEGVVDAINGMPTDDLAANIDKQRLPDFALARNQNKQRTASKKNLEDTIVGWLADLANHANVPSDEIALAAKLFGSYRDAAIEVLRKSMRTAEVKVTDETMHTTTIMATLDDLGIDAKDAGFNQKFRDYAVELLSQSGYEIDPATFALTEITVCEDGCVTGRVSTRATKSFKPDMTAPMQEEYVDPDKMAIMSPEPMAEPTIEQSGELLIPGEDMQNMIMSESAKSLKRLARIKNIVKIAQGLGLPGAGAANPGMGGPQAGPVDPNLGMDMGAMAGGAGDLGMSSLTGASGMEDATVNDTPEPGTKSPWGTVCPQCGSKDVDIANGEGSCNSCGSQLKYKFIVEVAPPEDGAQAEDSLMPETPEVPAGGLGEALGGGQPAPQAAGAAMPGAPAQTGVPQMPMAANNRVMTKIAYKTTADVYARALSEGFDKTAADKLPVGMICPACGSRTASKKGKHTYCYDCNTISVSNVKKVAGEPGVLEAEIVWI